MISFHYYTDELFEKITARSIIKMSFLGCNWRVLALTKLDNLFFRSGEEFFIFFMESPVGTEGR